MLPCQSRQAGRSPGRSTLHTSRPHAAGNIAGLSNAKRSVPFVQANLIASRDDTERRCSAGATSCVMPVYGQMIRCLCSRIPAHRTTIAFARSSAASGSVTVDLIISGIVR